MLREIGHFDTKSKMVTDSEIILPSDRRFGATTGFLFAAIAIWATWHGYRQWAAVLAMVAALLGGLAIAMPSFLHPLNRAWMTLGAKMSAVVSPLVMALIFFFLITPVALAGRALGRDELRLRRDAGGSLWRLREVEQRGVNFRRQF